LFSIVLVIEGKKKDLNSWFVTKINRVTSNFIIQ